MGLSGPLDTRSRPADLGPGVLRYKLNLAVNSSGKLSRRAGHAALNFGLRSDDPAALPDWDFHRRGRPRKPVTSLSEVVSPDNVRYLFAAADSTASWLNNDTSEWTDIITNAAAGSHWQIASLRDKVVLTNNVDEVKIHTIGSAGTTDLSALPNGINLTKAKVAIQYQNVVLLMNVEIDGNRESNGIYWCDFRDAEYWAETGQSIAGFQYLDDGEVILNAVELAGIVYIFTDRAIWRLFPNVSASSATNSVFGVQRWYSDPKNRANCLAYDNGVISTGKEIFWLGRSTIFWLNQFSSAPASPDWLLKGSGLMFEGAARLDPLFCQSPVAGFVPDATGAAKEVWFSYPQLGTDIGINDQCLVLSFNTDSTVSPYTTADYVDHGYTAFCNFSRTPAEGITCNTSPTFIGASGEDYCLKSIGGVFYREMVTLVVTDGDPDVTADIADATYAKTQRGYFSRLMFLCPFGLDYREKILRDVILTHDTPYEVTATPNQVSLRVGNSYHLADPLSTAPRGGVQWHDIGTRDLLPPDVDDADKMVKDGTRSDDATEWPDQAEQGAFLYVDLKVQSFTGTAPVGSDSAWSNVGLDYLVLPA